MKCVDKPLASAAVGYRFMGRGILEEKASLATIMDNKWIRYVTARHKVCIVLGVIA